MENRAAASMVEVLAPIWERVLQRPSIGVEENFFDVGGDPGLAAILFSEIAKACGRNFLPVTILQAPTILAQAALLEQRAEPALPPVIPLKAGIGKAPVFMAPGLGGNVLGLLPMARQIQSPRAIFGMVARGADGAEKPFERVEEIAEYYISAIRKVQSHGPYLLIGASFGGLVMLEIAQRLSREGEEIGLLAMLDAYPHIRFLKMRERLRLLSRRGGNRISMLKNQPMRETMSYVADRIRDQFSKPGNSANRARDRLTKGMALSPTMLRLRDGDFEALVNYRPRFYNGKVRFVRADVVSHFPHDPAAIWDRLTKDFEVETVPGDHVDMIATHFKVLASVLTRFLEEVLA